MMVFARTIVALIVLVVLGEHLVAPAVAIGGVAPDFAVIAVVILAMARGARAGALGGFTLGLIQDLAVPTMLGLHALCKSLLGFAVGRTRGRLVYGLVPVEAGLVLVGGRGPGTVFMLIQSRQESEVFLRPWLADALPTALYTALAGAPLIRLADLGGLLRRED